MTDIKPRGIKAPLSLLPAKPLRAIAAAMLDGATKYERNNWRVKNPEETDEDRRHVYTSAALRHLYAFIDPDFEDSAEDSGVYHLAHAGACILILLYHEGSDFVVPKSVKAKRATNAKAA